jgi:hypothetical protein
MSISKKSQAGDRRRYVANSLSNSQGMLGCRAAGSGGRGIIGFLEQIAICWASHNLR